MITNKFFKQKTVVSRRNGRNSRSAAKVAKVAKVPNVAKIGQRHEIFDDFVVFLSFFLKKLFCYSTLKNLI